METRLTAWTPFGISGSVRMSHQTRLMFIHERYQQHQEQQCTTDFMCTCKSKNGRDLLVDCVRQSGGGSNVTMLMGFVPLQTYLAPAPENLLRVIRLTAAPCDARARSTTLSALPLVETAGDLAARTYCSCLMAMMKMMILRTYKCNSLDCLYSNNMCLTYCSCHVAMMKMMTLRTYKM